MRGFAYLEKGKAGWVERETPVATGLDVVIRPLVVSPCTSDVHNVECGYVAPGRILGHEGAGEVVQVGELVRDFKPGDRVLVSALTPDFRAVLSQKGVPQHFAGPLSGNVVSNTQDGLMAEYTLIPDGDANLARIPDGIELETAVMAADMMATGLYGAEMADIEFGDTVVVLGIGPVGLMAVAGAKLKGAGRIIAVGSRPACVAAARAYGATDIVNYKEGDIVKQIRALTDRKGADRCIIAGGGDDALNQGVCMVRYGGTVSNVNYFTTTGNLEISNPRWGYGMSNKTIRGGMTSGGRARMENLLELIRYGRIDPSLLVTHRLEGLDAIPEAFHLMETKPADLIKVCVRLG